MAATTLKPVWLAPVLDPPASVTCTLKVPPLSCCAYRDANRARRSRRRRRRRSGRRRWRCWSPSRCAVAPGDHRRIVGGRRVGIGVAEVEEEHVAEALPALAAGGVRRRPSAARRATVKLGVAGADRARAVGDLDAERDRAERRFRIDVRALDVVAAVGIGDDLAAAAGRAGHRREVPSPQVIVAV